MEVISVTLKGDACGEWNNAPPVSHWPLTRIIIELLCVKGCNYGQAAEDAINSKDPQ
jgi:hypothetical protein